MDLIDSIQKRQSTRKFKKTLIPADQIAQLSQAFKEAHRLANPHVRLLFIKGKEIERYLEGAILNYGKIHNASHYVVVFTKEGFRYMANVGFMVEQLVLKATALNLDSCWIGGYFEEEIIKKIVEHKKGERIAVLIALGYRDDSMKTSFFNMSSRLFIPNMGKKIASNELVYCSTWKGQLNKEFRENARLKKIFEQVRLAPSWANYQPYRYLVDQNRIFVCTIPLPKKGMIMKEGKNYSELDCGISMAHFHLAALNEGYTGAWNLKLKEADIKEEYIIPAKVDLIGEFRLIDSQRT